MLDGDLSENQYAFTGRQLDPESGLYHFHFRQYDAANGVWTTPDPIGILGGVNLYGYVGNNPVNWVDILGLHLGGPEGPGEHGDIGGSESNAEDESDGESKDSFPTQDEAAVAALDKAMLESVKKQEEYGGYICQDPVVGQYTYTEPESTGKSKNLDMSGADTCEKGKEKTATYHTHPSGSKNSEFFSFEDNLYTGRYGDLYLGTPRGTVKVNRPGSGPETIRCGR